MKKMLALILVLMMVLAVTACGSDKDKDSDKKDDKKNETSKPDDKKDDDKKDDNNPVGTGAVIAVTGDSQPLPAGSQAHDHWHAKETVKNYEFDKDGNCLKNESIYYLDDPANKDEANNYLVAADWKPEWSADNTYFTIDNGFIKYTDTDDAFEYFDARYYGYTIKYDNGTTKHVDAPSDAEKMVNVKKIFGLDILSLKGVVGDFTIATWQRDVIQGTIGSNATVDQMNELCAKLFEICKPLAEDGKMYTYLGKYGDELTEAPKEESQFGTAEFHYFYGGQEVKVSVGINQSDDNTPLAVYVGIVK